MLVHKNLSPRERDKRGIFVVKAAHERIEVVACYAVVTIVVVGFVRGPAVVLVGRALVLVVWPLVLTQPVRCPAGVPVRFPPTNMTSENALAAPALPPFRYRPFRWGG